MNTNYLDPDFIDICYWARAYATQRANVRATESKKIFGWRYGWRQGMILIQRQQLAYYRARLECALANYRVNRMQETA